jgi:hypothetical protein
MDPYLEMQAAWPDFHNGLIAEIRNELGARLPDPTERRGEVAMGIGIERVKKSRAAAVPAVQQKATCRHSVREIRKFLEMLETQAFYTELDLKLPTKPEAPPTSEK